MRLTAEQFSKIEHHFPKSRGKVEISNLVVINALLHIMYQGHSWRALPKSYGPWHTIYIRFNRGSKNGVLARVYKALQEEGFVPQTTQFAGLDSTSVSVHKHGTGAKKNGKQCIGISRGGRTTKIHAVTADEHVPLCLTLSAGNRHDAPIGRQLLKSGCPKVGCLLMDKAYEDDETRKVAAGIADEVVVPPKSNRTEKWDYDEKAYENRNEVERFFGSIK